MPPAPKPVVVLGLLGTTLDAGKGPPRWERWRPTVSLCQQEHLAVARLELLHSLRVTSLAQSVEADIRSISPETTVNRHLVELADPWDFEEVYGALHDFVSAYPFDTDREDYLVHITTGTHVAQICLFLLAEARVLPAKLVQTSPRTKTNDPAGKIEIIDLDLSRYDSIARRFEREHKAAVAGLKSGIATRSAPFNALIDQIEHVAANSTDPMLLTGPTGAGKSQLARRIYELKKGRRLVEGAFVEVNCATLRGDAAMSTLFGHRKGAFTGAVSDRPGLLVSADNGLLFLDEIGELGLDEQAMLLRAVEEKRFLPLGADRESSSRFQLIAGTNRDLNDRVRAGAFRDDLLARINLWTFALPPLRERREDIEPNLDYELESFARRSGRIVRFSTEARAEFLAFAAGPGALWPGNFRDLSASITRMATLAPAGRITGEFVAQEVSRLKAAWASPASDSYAPAGPEGSSALDGLLAPEALAAIDLFDRLQLESVIGVCRHCRTISEAGRRLFAASRVARGSVNDADRLRKYLARFGLQWSQIG